jgi:D-alanine--poly(phosphoribitol) ligase subunit 1
MNKEANLVNIFLAAVNKTPEAPALCLRGQYFSFKEIYEWAVALASELKKSSKRYCLLCADRSLTAYVGMLACFLEDKICVPMYSKAPETKTFEMIELVETDLMIIDAEHREMAEHAATHFQDRRWFVYHLNEAPDKINIIAPHVELSAISPLPSLVPVKLHVHQHEHLLLLFTSGSTGAPKGVLIHQAGIINYLHCFAAFMPLSSSDHCAHLTEFTFDFSLHEIFCAWFVGACVYRYTGHYVWELAKYLVQEKITFLAIVPALAMLLYQLHSLTPNHFPDLKYTLFGGEPLSIHTVHLWEVAAPQSRIFNIYGPTETTVVVSAYEYTGKEPRAWLTLPIGRLFTGQDFRILAEDLSPVATGEVGELYLAGNQLAEGYFKNSALTESRFRTLPQEGERIFYKTGDLVYFDPAYGLFFVSRVDDQIKIRGYRIDKVEVEQTLKVALKTDALALVPQLDINAHTQGLILCCLNELPLTTEEILDAARQVLPYYSVPTRVERLGHFPLTTTGKINYVKLREQVK